MFYSHLNIILSKYQFNFKLQPCSIYFVQIDFGQNVLKAFTFTNGGYLTTKKNTSGLIAQPKK